MDAVTYATTLSTHFALAALSSVGTAAVGAGTDLGVACAIGIGKLHGAIPRAADGGEAARDPATRLDWLLAAGKLHELMLSGSTIEGTVAQHLLRDEVIGGEQLEKLLKAGAGQSPPAAASKTAAAVC